MTYQPKTRPNLKCQWLSAEQAEKQGYRPYAGYYLPSEYWMCSPVEADLIAAKKEYVAVAGNSRGIMIYSR